MNDITIGEMVDAISSFHTKHGFSAEALPLSTHTSQIPQIVHAGHDLKRMSEKWEEQALAQQAEGDPRMYRFCLMVEELGELVLGIGSGDPELIADGATDLLYTLLGSFGVTYSFPWTRAFREVHRSNMTKKRRTGSGDRMRDKGPSYKKPDWKSVLSEDPEPPMSTTETLQALILMTPTGPVREKLTEAHILLMQEESDDGA